ncbi:MAG: hypothetical protein KDD67_17305 [Ignavibacteriae bacterium]|nr:hypothetical protein [Ignavibacteriota bacterium]MCB9217425.1 hypothetical protein [Ignavibacteria bacterium]
MKVLSPLLGLFVFFSSLVENTTASAQIELGGYFSAGGAFTSINSSNTILPTVDAGLIVNGRFHFAGSMSALVPTIKADSLSTDGKPLFINFFYAGGRAEYIHNPDDFFQYGGGFLFGGGSLSFSLSNPHHNDSVEGGKPSYGFSLFEPHINGQLRLAEGLRLHARLGWRLTFGEDSGSEPAGELGGATFFAGFRFGWFGG